MGIRTYRYSRLCVCVQPESVLSCCHNGGCYTLPEMAEAEGNSGTYNTFIYTTHSNTAARYTRSSGMIEHCAPVSLAGLYCCILTLLAVRVNLCVL
jgi:hypothetical protein